MRKIKVGVIGVGYLGVHHARILSGIEDAELIGVADIDRQKAEGIAGEYGCMAFTDYADLMPLIDAVSIVTPTTTHYRIALDCLRHGKDLLVEKPFTATIEEADSILRHLDGTGRIVQVGHLERFNPVVIAVEGMIENPRFFESERLSPFLGRGTDVDVTLDLMIHDIDIILTLCHSKVTEVSAIGAKVLTDKLDVSKAWVEMANGVKALITASRLSNEKRRVLKIFQDSGYIMLDYQNLEVIHYRKDTSGGIMREAMNAEPVESLREELEDFVACVKHRRRPRVTVEDGREALRVALEINRKIKENL